MIVVVTVSNGTKHQEYLIHVDNVNKNVLSGIIRDVTRIFCGRFEDMSMEVGTHTFYWTSYTVHQANERIAEIFDTKHEPMSPVSEK